MEAKRTNLCIAADVASAADLLALAETTGVASDPGCHHGWQSGTCHVSFGDVAATSGGSERGVVAAGPHICCFKTHCDLVNDWSNDTATGMAGPRGQNVAGRRLLLLVAHSQSALEHAFGA